MSNAMDALAQSESVPDGAIPEGRRRLLANGFEPIILNGKVPLSKGWQHGDITTGRLTAWEEEHGRTATGTGLRCGRLAVVDIDLADAELAEEIGSAVQGVLGLSDFRRIGAKGFQLCYYSPEPLRKVTISGRLPGEDKPRTLVELLGQGQQTAAYGPHPSTGQPFTWPEANPLEARLEELPKVTRAELRRAVIVARDHLEEIGAEDVKVSGDLEDNTREVQPISEDAPVTEEMFRQMFARIDPGCPYPEWVGWAFVIAETPLVNECGEPVEDFDRSAFWHDFSAGHLNPDFDPCEDYDEGEAERVWKSLKAPDSSKHRRTVASLIMATRENGYIGKVHAHTADEIAYLKVPAVCGIERLRGIAKAANDDVEMEDRRPFKLRSETDQDKAADPVWLIPSVLQEETLALFYGPENSFKSFLVLDLALSAAAGLPWASYGAKADAGGYPPIRPLTVVYVAGEGSRAIEKVRRPAWRAARGVDRPLAFYTVEAMPEFRDPTHVDALVEEIESAGVDPDVIVIDTLARAMTGLDENSAKDTGILVSGLDYLKRRFRCSVIGVHHSGKDAQKGARGSTNLPASFDARFAVSADRAALVGYIRNEKQKDGEPLEGRLVFKGYQERGSLVFRCEPPAPGFGVSKDDERVEEVRAALASMGADERIVATNWLAERIVDTRLEKDPATSGKLTQQDRDRMVRNEKRNIQRQVKDRADGGPGILHRFIFGPNEGGDLSWTLPQVGESES